MHPILKLGVLAVFSVLIGLNCIAASSRVSEAVVKVAIVSTLAIFVGMTVLGGALLALGIPLNFMGFALMCALLGLLVAFVVMMFVPVSNTMHKAILAIGMTLFSVFIAFDTNVMVQKTYKGDPVDASIQLYLDIVNIFTEMVAFESQ